MPVTAPVRSGDGRILISVHRGHRSLERLRAQPQVALTILADGNEAFTARGRARVAQEPMAGAPDWAAVAIDGNHVDDHRQPSELVDAGAAIHRTDPRAEPGLQERVAALTHLAGTIG